MKRAHTTTSRFSRQWRWAAVAVAAVAMLATFTASAFADAGNPILGTIHGTIVQDASGPGVTLYVRGQWNWLSHNSDCNFDRAATGVGIVWNDPQFPDGNSSDASDPRSAKNEVQRVTITGTIQPAGTIRLKFDGKETTNTAVGNNATSAANIQSALNALSTVGGVSGSVTVALTTATPTTHSWDVTFGGSLATTDVPALQVSNRTNAGSGASVTEVVKGKAQQFNGWPLQGFYIGTQLATTGNLVDRMVHPVDRGNQVEGYTSGTWTSTTQGYTTNTAGDWPQGQQFADPSPPGVTTTQATAWKGGCGREPLAATASKASPGPGMEPTGLSCANGTTECANEPWGSWGYEKNGGLGYSHHFAKRTDLTTVCANFYDVHGGGKFGTSNFQKVNGTKEITVDSNGDNSIETNAFNIAQGANCFSFSVTQPTIATTASGGVTIGGSISDSATLSGGSSPTGSITFRVYAPKADGTADPSCSTLVGTLGPVAVSGNGTYQSGPFTPNGTGSQIAGTYQWIASYSGDGSNGPAAGSCNGQGEQSVVNKKDTTVPTAQTIAISDTAKVTGDNPVGGDVKFELFSTANCSGNAVFTNTKTLPAGGIVTSEYSQDLDSNLTYSWRVTYLGDANNVSAASPCGTEQTTISGNAPGVLP